MDFDVNWLAVLVGTVAHQLVGALWYAALFRKTWLNAMGMTQEQIEQGAGGGASFAFGGLCSLLSVVALAMIIGLIGSPSVTDGIVAGAVTGIGFIGAATFMNGFYEQKKPILSAIFSGYYTVGLVVAGAILGAWQ
jgi:hypothetical protein